VNVFGYEAEELVGKVYFYDLHPSSMRDEFREKGMQLIHGGENLVDFVNPVEKKDGTVIWVLSNAKPLFDSKGTLIGYRGADNDITGIKEAEEKIKQQNARLSAFMNAMPDIIFLTNRQGDYLEYFHSSVNKEANDYSDLVGKNVRDAFDATTAELHLSNIRQSLETGEIITYEYPRYEDGLLKHYEGRIVALDDERVLRFVRDITTQKAYETEIKKLTMAIEQSPVAIVITDLKANIQYASPAFFHFTGYTPEEVLGQNTKILKSGKTPDRVYADMWNTITKGETWRGEWVNKKKSGDLYWESISITPVVDTSGNVSGYLAIKEEITDRKQNEEKIRELNATLEHRIEERTQQLAKSNSDLLDEIGVRRKMETELLLARNEAEMANQAKSEFLSRMSHELRTPMNSILGFAQLLGMSTLTESQEKSVKHILRGGEHLLSLINEVLDISRIESGTISLSIEPVEINGLVDELIETVTPYADSRNIRISYDNVVDGNIHVSADRQRIKQILLNLIDNAIKYNTDNGSVLIKTQFQEGSKNKKPSVRISVIDTGVGISTENIGKIFNPFERIGADSTQIEGTGLGLAVVKKLTELMYGKLGVTSEIGNGSTFWIEFEYATPISKQIDPSVLKAASSLQHTINMKSVLYVEDNLPNVELVEQVLGTARPNIQLVNTIYGAKTIELATEHAVDLILLDLNLPDMHGSEVLSKIRSNRFTKSIPVVVISADAMSKQKESLLLAGANEYLTKPLVLEEFLNVVDKYIR
jgi:PAS domain S-box-containing protein